MLIIDHLGKHRSFPFGTTLVGLRYTSCLITPEEIVTSLLSDDEKIAYIKKIIHSREGRMSLSSSLPPTAIETKAINQPIKLVPMCDKNDCKNAADGALAIKLFPFEALQKQHQSFTHVSKLILGINVCTTHFLQLKPSEVIAEEQQRVMGRINPGHFEIDPRLSELEMLKFDDPDYLTFIRLTPGETITDPRSSSEEENPASSS